MYSFPLLRLVFRFFSEDENFAQDAERKLRHQMSSGFGTQPNDSHDEPTYGESIEMRTICPTNSTETDPEAPLLQRTDSDQDNEAYLHYQKSLLMRSPSYRKSLDRLSLLSSTKSTEEERSQDETVKKLSQTDISWDKMQRVTTFEEQPPIAYRGPYKDIPRMSSDQSLNTLSNDQDELLVQSNLRDELLNCEQKELFQFLSDDFDNSNNYFSDTVGFGSALIDPETDNLVYDDSKRDDFMSSPPRKTSSSSMRSNFSYISNSIFAALEAKRGGSISESIDRMLTRSVSNNIIQYPDSSDREPLVDSEFENIIASFEKELNEIKKSTPSLNRNLSISSDEQSEQKKSHSVATNKNSVSSKHPQAWYEQPDGISTDVVVHQRRSRNGSNGSSSNSNRESVKLKRRSLEKQNNIDDGFNVSNEIRKICDQMHAPFNKMLHTSASANGAMNSATTATANVTSSTSPNLRRKNDFHSSFDRIKRTSLIERVDETAEEFDARPVKIVSEKLPRKYLTADLKLDSISLKSTGSYENLITSHQKMKPQQKPSLVTQRSKDSGSKIGDKKAVTLVDSTPEKSSVKIKEEKKSLLRSPFRSPNKSPKTGKIIQRLFIK